jgi:hypothetical protein
MSKTSTTSIRRSHVTVAAAFAAVAVLGSSAYAGAVGPGSHASAHVTSAATAQAHLRLQPSSPVLAGCFPHAGAKVKVDLTTDQIGKDTFTIRAHDLKPKTDFTVFLVETPGAPFGAAEYIGDITTDRYGRAYNQFSLIVEEAFAFNNVTQSRTDLNSVGVWFADPKDDDGCLGAASPVTGFDGDASAGVQMLNSGVDLLP